MECDPRLRSVIETATAVGQALNVSFYVGAMVWDAGAAGDVASASAAILRGTTDYCDRSWRIRVNQLLGNVLQEWHKSSRLGSIHFHDEAWCVYNLDGAICVDGAGSMERNRLLAIILHLLFGDEWGVIAIAGLGDLGSTRWVRTRVLKYVDWGLYQGLTRRDDHRGCGLTTIRVGNHAFQVIQTARTGSGREPLEGRYLSMAVEDWRTVAELLTTLGLKPSRRFTKANGDRVAIYWMPGDAVRGMRPLGLELWEGEYSLPRPLPVRRRPRPAV